MESIIIDTKIKSNNKKIINTINNINYIMLDIFNKFKDIIYIRINIYYNVIKSIYFNTYTIRNNNIKKNIHVNNYVKKILL